MGEWIASRQNSRYRGWKLLAESAGERRARGLALLDGEHLLEAFLASGGVPLQVLVCEEPDAAAWQQRCPQAEVVLLTRPLFDAISPVRTPTGVMAVVQPPVWPQQASHFAVLLERIQDPGNLGAMLRSAAAAGVDSVWLSDECADAWSPKTLRGGMGAHFALRIVEQADLVAVARDFPGLVCATALDAGEDLYQADLRGPLAFVFGNEGAGLSPALRAAVSASLRIPMPGRMESLNVAAALAVCLFERVRQTR